jgi:hypothetical protein
MLNMIRCGPSNHNVINIDQHKDLNTIVLENEERGIRLGRNKTKLDTDRSAMHTMRDEIASAHK